MRVFDRNLGAGLVTAAALLALGCGGPDRAATMPNPARVGLEPLTRIHIYENHSSALIAWKRAGVADRTLIHLDGHADFDWLPDETVARLAAASADELPGLELHPYALNGETYSRFGIWNFVFPAFRMGLVSRMVWVVPDGTLRDAESVRRLARDTIVGRMQGIAPEEALGLQIVGRSLQGVLVGMPFIICELADLPSFDEPVLLDIDLDYFTTRSATTQWVTESPWITPEAVLQVLEERQIETDLVTMSLSTIGGYLPPANRWLGPSLTRLLRDPEGGEISDADEILRAEAAVRESRFEEAAGIYLARVERDPEDASAWFRLARVRHLQGRTPRATQALEKALGLDPVLAHAELFEADRLWINHQYVDALSRFDGYIDKHPQSPFLSYAIRRKASCLMHLGRDPEAIAAYRRVIQLSPEHGDSRLDLALLLRDQGDVRGALDQLRTARSILPERASYAMALGTTYLMGSRVEAGIQHLEDAVARRPSWARARGNLAAALHAVGRYEDAASHLHVALSVQPAQPRLRALAADLERRGVAVQPVRNPIFR